MKNTDLVKWIMSAILAVAVTAAGAWASALSARVDRIENKVDTLLMRER